MASWFFLIPQYIESTTVFPDSGHFGQFKAITKLSYQAAHTTSPEAEKAMSYGGIATRKVFARHYEIHH